jgi:ATP-dependent helicase HrpA
MEYPENSPQARRAARIQQLHPIEFPADLPVVAKRDALARGIAENQVVIVCGETGSGKTTQLPKICLSIGRGIEGMIGHTQPRRVAARSVASRIAYELKSELGSAVGYRIRFNDKVSPHTCVKLMTDGILLAELQGDPLLKKYDTIIIDEAHERSLNIDFLLGCLKQILPRRPDLRLIITSATLDAERFSGHFGNAPVFQVSGRSYPVEIRYRPPQENDEGDVQDMPQAICSALDEISVGGLKGDVLVFLPGEREIREAAEALRKHHPPTSIHGRVEILPLYSRLSAAEQDRVFNPASGLRRAVLATNVAETSLTVPNIGYVIDTGLARINRYSLRQKVEQLHIEKISQAAANQRAGRCGRVMNGICVRLYEESEFSQRPAYTDAEIFRVSLATVILRMAALRLGEVEQFPFLEAPGSRVIADGYQLLAELGAIDDANKLTSLGRELARLPLDPRIARLLLAGKQHQCLSEILVIASALSLQDPRERPQERREAADAAHQRFNDERSDFLTYLKIWAWFRHAVQHKKSNRQLASLCREHFLSPLRLREWHDLYQQLHAMMLEMGMLHHSGHEVAGGTISQELYARIHKALLTGLLGNIGMKSVDSMQYLGARGIKFFVAPNSVLAKKGAKWVMAAELTETHKLYARCVARIEPQWLEEVGAHQIKRHYYDPHWEKKAAQVAAWERSTLHGLVINPKKRIHYGPMNPEEAREVFIRQALVTGEFNTQAPFFAHNRKLIRDIEALEHKSRRPDILVDDELIFAFYDTRIPHEFEGHGIHNGATFEYWRKQAERDDPRLLFLKKDDLMRHEAAGITTDQFPPQLEMNNVSYALAYHFAPGQKDDGVTLTAPQALLNQVSIARCEWLVPGLLEDKTARLLKTLPQKLRRHLVPLPEFAARFCAEVQPSDTPLLQALARFIREQKQLDTPLDAFHLEQLPLHLAMNFRVIDEHGRQLGMSRNFAHLRTEWVPKTTAATPSTIKAAAPEKLAAECHKSWDFGKFEDTARQQRAGHTITVFNALQDEGDAVTLQSYDTHEEALTTHRKGLTRLFLLTLKEQVKYLEKNLPDAQKLGMLFLPFGSQQDLQRQILAVTCERCCLMEPWPTNEKEFAARAREAKSRLNLVGQEIARLVGGVLMEYHALQKALPSFKAHNQVTQDIRQQLEWLLGKDWIARTPYERLQHLPRYLKAISVRLDKLRASPARDAQQLAQLLPLQQQWQRRLSGHANEPDARLDDFGWLLQELRVSLFAQELKTPVIVSVKRLQKALDAIDH